MDPDANLKEQLELAQKFYGQDDLTFDGEDVIRLAELVIALNEWIKNGGFLPKDWRPKI